MDSLVQGSLKKHHGGGSSAIMNSIDPLINNATSDCKNPKKEKKVAAVYPDIEKELHSLSLEPGAEPDGNKAVLLIDDKEDLKIKSESAFLKALNIKPDQKVKVVSIFGNTGEGKSYTLNKVFFNGDEIFKTSPSQVSCTIGIWAKYDPVLHVICFDTEGFLGMSKKEDQRTRLLLKILAVSDIIIYRTKAERLLTDLYTFLGSASEAYKKHFSPTLKKALSKVEGAACSTSGPGVIIFHETQHTDTLHNLDDTNGTAEDILRENFANQGVSPDAFSFLKYVGIKTPLQGKTTFELLKTEIQKRLDSTELTSPRDPKHIYLMLKHVNAKFQSALNDRRREQYLMQFFTCPDKCESCKTGCKLSMGHENEGQAHQCDSPCKYQHQFQNSVHLCKKCVKNGERTIVKPSYQTTRDNSWTSYFSYVWTGYVIECPKCGEIYRSRQHWYGNKDPEESAVQMEVVHIWPGERMLFGTYNSAQKMVDGVSVITDAVASVSSPPAKVITDWVHDKIAPSYWRPNSDIKFCFQCRTSFVSSGQNRILPSKHHCRSCGEGFCESCSSKKCEVPQRGWTSPVRVCDSCYDCLEGRGVSLLDGVSQEEQITEVRARYITETVVSSISAVKSVLDTGKDLIKESARPSYWTPDSQCVKCILCNNPFGSLLPLHHCRDCGKGVCDNCSKSRKPVPLKGWDSPVRVCDSCR